MAPTSTCDCPIERTALLLGDKWTLLIVRDLAQCERRFSELERSLAGISPKTLSERLKRLEEADILSRTCHPEAPPRVVYALTPKGEAFVPVIECMRSFGMAWLPEVESTTDS